MESENTVPDLDGSYRADPRVGERDKTPALLGGNNDRGIKRKRNLEEGNYRTQKPLADRDVNQQGSNVGPGGDSGPAKSDFFTRRTLTIKRRRSAVTGPCHLLDKCCDEILLKVLDWLPRTTLAKVAATCSTLNRMIKDPHLWKKVNVSGKALPQKTLGTIASRGALAVRAAKATLAEPAISQEQMLSMQPSAARLVYLDLSMATISIPDLERLFSVCSSLSHISLEAVPVSDEVLRQLGNSSALQVLNLAMSEGVTEAGVAFITRSCRQIKELNLAWTGLTPQALNILCQGLSDSVLKLNLSGNRSTLSDDHVLALVERCHYMTELDLSDSGQITDDAITYIVRHLEELVHFHAARCYTVIPATFLLFDDCPSLESLNVFALVKGEGLKELRRHLTRVQINKTLFSEIARPTVGIRRTSIWGIRVRD